MADFLAGRSRNDCEKLVRRLYPRIDAALSELNQFAEARMTGTGASVFAAFEREDRAKSVAKQLLGGVSGMLEGSSGFVARGVSRSGLSLRRTDRQADR